MWIQGNYRRNLMDMHIDDWNEEFLSKIDPDEYVNALADAHVQCAMVKAKPHTGLCYWPCETGRMHRGLKGRDFFGEMVEKCHAKGIKVIAYYSQIFDNWAYDHHPEWRLVTPDGKNFREYRGMDQFRNGRYGICCPNNAGYREYVRKNLQELNRKYDFEGMFLDMTFWPEICYCPACRKRYFDETGREMPRVINWDDPDFRDFAYRLDLWMTDFAAFATDSVKAVKPEVTVEHQFSRITMPWFNGCTELVTKHVDYCGGDYYGGYLQQTFINKYYKSVSPNLPFVYHTGRCDPELSMHTTTKTEEQILLHAVTALIHNGAFLLVDAINPDGSIVPWVYHDLMKRVYAKTMPIEKYVSGKLNTDVGIWLASHAKYDPDETMIGTDGPKNFDPTVYLEAPVAMASILRENNVPFDVIGSGNLANYKGKVLALCHVASIRDEEMDAIEQFVARGGSLYVSGTVGHPRLEKLLGIHVTGKTPHTFTYMAPAGDLGTMQGFSADAPMTVARRQYIAEKTADDVQILATRTLPYCMTGMEQFAAIHSNPPGVRTSEPCITLRTQGESKLLWMAAPAETQKPYMTRQAVCRMVKLLTGETSWSSDAPKFVEVISWNKDGRLYFAAVNEQEESPVVPMRDIRITVPGEGHTAHLLPNGEELPVQNVNGSTVVTLDRVDLFTMLTID